MSEGMIPCPPPDFEPRPPQRLRLPPGATDCHSHVFGPASRYPYDPGRSYTPPDCSLAQYRHMLATLGVERAVLVQPSVYGTDNRAHLDALGEAGPGFRMVAVIDPGAPQEELERMHAAGVRGVRINALNAGGLTLEALGPLVRRLESLGWHLQMHVDIGTLARLESQLAALPVPLVIDHMGHAPVRGGVHDPGFQALLRLVRAGNTWVKLSGSYRITREEHPPYGDVVPIATALIEANAERMVWATDWPHPMVNERPMPNDGDLVEQLADWAPDEALRRKILTDNPARLYDFPAA